MGQIIYLHPARAAPGQLLLLARQRAGLTHAEIAPLLGDAIGRPELNPATVRAWERGTVRVPSKVVDAAQRIASTGTPRTDGGSVSAVGELEAPIGRDAIERAMQSFREADRRVGGGYMYGSVIRYLRDEIAPSLVDSSEDRFTAAAALTEMAGWMAHDAGHDGLAQQHFSRALQFTSMSDDVELTAHVHASLCHLAMQHERPRDTLPAAPGCPVPSQPAPTPPGARCSSARDAGPSSRMPSTSCRLCARTSQGRGRTRSPGARCPIAMGQPVRPRFARSRGMSGVRDPGRSPRRTETRRARCHPPRREPRPKPSLRSTPTRRHPPRPGRARPRMHDHRRRSATHRRCVVPPRLPTRPVPSRLADAARCCLGGPTGCQRASDRARTTRPAPPHRRHS